MATQTDCGSWLDAAINPALVPETGTAERRGERVLEIREILWGDTLLSVTQHRRPLQILAGEGKGCDLFLPAELLTRDPFPLLRADEDGLLLGVCDGMQGYLERRGRRTPLCELHEGELGMPSLELSTREAVAFEVPLEPDDQVLVSLGSVTLFLRQVARVRPVRESLVKAMNWSLAAIMLFSLAAVGGLIGGATVHGYDVEGTEVPARIAEVMFRPPPPRPRVEPEPAAEEKPQPAMARPSGGRPGPEGKVGSEESKVALAKGTPRRAFTDEQVASDAGILGILGRADMRDLDAVFEQGAGALGHLDEFLGNADRGVASVDQRGMSGYGLRGDGKGSGNPDFDISGFATDGRGARLKGYKNTRLGDGEVRRIKIPDGPAFTGEIRGSLARSVIDRVLKRYYAQLRYCYQQQLVVKPHLHGKVKVQFIIAETGHVKEAYVLPAPATTMADEDVQDCVCRVIQRIKFPRPKHGIVVVRYPLVFSSQG